MLAGQSHYAVKFRLMVAIIIFYYHGLEPNLSHVLATYHMDMGRAARWQGVVWDGFLSTTNGRSQTNIFTTPDKSNNK